MGLEPTTLWTTTRCSNQLSYDRHETISAGILPGFCAVIQDYFVGPGPMFSARMNAIGGSSSFLSVGVAGGAAGAEGIAWICGAGAIGETGGGVTAVGVWAGAGMDGVGFGATGALGGVGMNGFGASGTRCGIAVLGVLAGAAGCAAGFWIGATGVVGAGLGGGGTAEGFGAAGGGAGTGGAIGFEGAGDGFCSQCGRFLFCVSVGGVGVSGGALALDVASGVGFGLGVADADLGAGGVCGVAAGMGFGNGAAGLTASLASPFFSQSGALASFTDAGGWAGDEEALISASMIFC